MDLKVLLKQKRHIKTTQNTLWNKLFVQYYLHAGLEANRTPCLPIGHAPASCMP